MGGITVSVICCLGQQPPPAYSCAAEGMVRAQQHVCGAMLRHWHSYWWMVQWGMMPYLMQGFSSLHLSVSDIQTYFKNSDGGVCISGPPATF